MNATLEQLLEQLAAARNTAEQLGNADLIALTEMALQDAHHFAVHEGAIGRTS